MQWGQTPQDDGSQPDVTRQALGAVVDIVGGLLTEQGVREVAGRIRHALRPKGEKPKEPPKE